MNLSPRFDFRNNSKSSNRSENRPLILSSVNNGKPRSKQEAEKKPREIEQQFRDELKNINDGN